MHTFNFGDYYLRMIYCLQYSRKDHKDESRNLQAKFLFGFAKMMVLSNPGDDSLLLICP
jgi:hypothetical protein